MATALHVVFATVVATTVTGFGLIEASAEPLVRLELVADPGRLPLTHGRVICPPLSQCYQVPDNRYRPFVYYGNFDYGTFNFRPLGFYGPYDYRPYRFLPYENHIAIF